MFRLPLRSALRRSALAKPTIRPNAMLSTSALRFNSGQPRPSNNGPTPEGLEGVFGGKETVKKTPGSPPGSEALTPPGQPTHGAEEGRDQPSGAKNDGKDDDGSEWKDRRPRLSDEKGGKKTATGGGGGGGGGGGAGGPGQGGFGGLTPNQLLLAAIS